MRKHNQSLTHNAQMLRKSMTKEERHLWYDFLRGHQAKFYRQKVIGNYIVDFYCPSAKLVIELDGSQHYESAGIMRDSERSDYLNSLGISVMRFTNRDIHERFRGVCEAIDRYVSPYEPTSVQCSPCKEEEKSPPC